MPVGAGLLDLLGRGALDAAAADRARDPAVARVQQDGALGPRRGPERADDDGAADVDPLPLPGLERVEELLHRIGLAVSGSVGVPPTTVGRRGAGGRPDPGRLGHPGECRVRGRLAPPSRVGRADAAQDLAEPLERRDGPGRQEVVDVRVGRAHPAGQRLVAGRAGQRVEPHEPMAVAPQPGRLGGDERRVAAVPAVGHDDHDAARAQRPARPLLVERPEALADPRPAGPVVDGVGDPGERPVAVLVAQQPRDPRQPRPEHERLGAHLRRRRERLDEAQQQPRVALHRARDVAQHDERAGLLDRPPPDPRQQLAAGAEVAPEHRPRREPPAVRMQLVAAGPALLEPRDQRVDQPLGVAQLGRGHPVELAVAQHLAARVGVGRDDHALDVGVVVRVVVAGRRDRDAPLVGVRVDALVAGGRLGLAGGLALEVLVVASVAAAAAPRSRPPRRRRCRHHRSNTAS